MDEEKILELEAKINDLEAELMELKNKEEEAPTDDENKASKLQVNLLQDSLKQVNDRLNEFEQSLKLESDDLSTLRYQAMEGAEQFQLDGNSSHPTPVEVSTDFNVKTLNRVTTGLHKNEFQIVGSHSITFDSTSPNPPSDNSWFPVLPITSQVGTFPTTWVQLRGNATPLGGGAASAGSSPLLSRQDHVHPSLPSTPITILGGVIYWDGSTWKIEKLPHHYLDAKTGIGGGDFAFPTGETKGWGDNNDDHDLRYEKWWDTNVKVGDVKNYRTTGYHWLSAIGVSPDTHNGTDDAVTAADQYWTAALFKVLTTSHIDMTSSAGHLNLNANLASTWIIGNAATGGLTINPNTTNIGALLIGDNATPKRWSSISLFSEGWFTVKSSTGSVAIIALGGAINLTAGAASRFSVAGNLTIDADSYGTRSLDIGGRLSSDNYYDYIWAYANNIKLSGRNAGGSLWLGEASSNRFADIYFNGVAGVDQSSAVIGKITTTKGGVTALTTITPAADGTYTPVNSITIVDGHITAIS